MTICRFACVLAFLSLGLDSLASTIHVPQDQPTIQAGIDAATNGDTVLVAPGTFVENINFIGKAITVESSGGPSVTIIDGAQRSSVVTFNNGETLASVLSGFTIQNGNNYPHVGGGILVDVSSPTIVHNIITNNHACEGDGIGVASGSPVIRDNLISKNSDLGCGTGGGGISIAGPSSARIIHNRIIHNSTNSLGGGIALWSGTAVLIEDNTIVGNVGDQNGGGISIVNDASSVVIIQNLIYGNQSHLGNGVYWGNPPSAFVDNTIIDSPLSLPVGGTVWGDGFCCSPKIANNLIIAGGGAMNAFVCGVADLPPHIFGFNDVFSTNGPSYGGQCTDQTGIEDNISANPKFVNPRRGDFQLGSDSLAINHGRTFHQLPKSDLAGKTRVVGGVVDMGAYEYQGAEKQ